MQRSSSSQGHPDSANVLVSVPESQSGGNLELKAVSINAVRSQAHTIADPLAQLHCW